MACDWSSMNVYNEVFRSPRTRVTRLPVYSRFYRDISWSRSARENRRLPARTCEDRVEIVARIGKEKWRSLAMHVSQELIDALKCGMTVSS